MIFGRILCTNGDDTKYRMFCTTDGKYSIQQIYVYLYYKYLYKTEKLYEFN